MRLERIIMDLRHAKSILIDWFLMRLLLFHFIVTILLRMFYVLLFWTSLKDVRARENARGDTNGSHRYHQQRTNKQNKTKTKRQKYLAVARLLLPASKLLLPNCCFQRPFTPVRTDLLARGCTYPISVPRKTLVGRLEGCCCFQVVSLCGCSAHW